MNRFRRAWLAVIGECQRPLLYSPGWDVDEGEPEEWQPPGLFRLVRVYVTELFTNRQPVPVMPLELRADLIEQIAPYMTTKRFGDDDA